MKFIFCTALFLLMTSCTPGRASTSIKDVNGMSFLPLKLGNQLEVLVVHDPRFKKSSAAMAVMVGSLEDPENALGMAHYLEHMLFLGTKAFPKPEEYSTYMETYGGQDNAYTSDEITNYMFEVDHGAFEGALHRFSRFFIDPLFNADFLDREKNAVNNEFEKNIQQDNWRINRFINTLVIPQHPSAKFSTGNTQTLKDVDRDAVVAFYKKYYSANNMKLVVMSARPVREIKKWVETYFKQIPNLKVQRPKYNDFYLNFNTEKRLHFVKSINDAQELSVLFNIEDDRDFWASKPMSLIGRLLGDEGKGSLLSYLKQKGWALKLSSETLWRGFGVNVGLTPLGRKEYREVIKAIFSYIQFMKTTGYPKYLFDDASSLSKIDLENLEPSASANRAAWFAKAITDYPVDKFLERNFLLSKYSVKDFNRFLGYLQPEKSHIIISSKNEKTNSKEDIFGVEFSSEVLGSDLFQSPNNFDFFSYPEKNKYIPDNFSLVEKEKKVFDPKIKSLENSQGRVALQTDTSLGLAKSSLRLHVISAIEHNVRNKVLMDLFVKAKREEQREWSYPINEARAFFMMSPLKGDEMEINIAGYSQRLVDIFVDGLKNPQTQGEFQTLQISNSTFNDIKDEYRRGLLNIDELVAYSRLALEAGGLADSKGFKWRDYVQALNSIKLEDVQKFGLEFFKKIYVKGYAYGNIKSESVEKCIEALFLVTKARVLEEATAKKKEGQFRVVPVAKHYSVVIAGGNNNQAHLAFYRLSDWSIKNHALGLLIDQMVSQPYFSEMRTKQQLGYVARSGVSHQSGAIALTAIIQSSETDSKSLHEKSDTFLKNFFKEKSTTLTDDEIKPFKESVINELLLVPNTLGERTNQFLTAADKYNGRFTIRKEIADAVDKITAQQLMEFIQDSFLAEKKGLLVFYYSSKSSPLKQNTLPGEVFSDPYKIKKWDVLNPYIR